MTQEVKQEITETVSVSEVEGKTVVVNNQLDGSKKTKAMVIFGAIAVFLSGIQPLMPPNFAFIIEIFQMIAVFFAGSAVTSPYDKRALILNKLGLQASK